MNAEALVAENGVPVLASLIDFYVRVALSIKDSTSESSEANGSRVSDDNVADILAHCLHTLAGVAHYETGRDAIKTLSELTKLVVNWKQCIDGTLFRVPNFLQIRKSLNKIVRSVMSLWDMGLFTVVQGHILFEPLVYHCEL